MSEKPEMMLKRLRRLESNMKCPNCFTPAQPGIGFGNICIKYKTFVCDLCKTSHQAISHRVKSISMSTWTAFEVSELMLEQNGGNQVALHVWLANAPPPGGRYPGGVRPKEGDKVEIFKQFVTDCYEHGKFKATTSFDMAAALQAAPVASQKAKPAAQQSSQRSLPPAAAPQEVDFMAFDSPAEASSHSFGAFEGQPSQPTFNAFQSHQAQPTVFDFNSSAAPVSRGTSDFICDFGDFPTSAPTFAAPSISSTTAPPSVPFDAFGLNQQSFHSAPGPTVAPSFDPFSNNINHSASTPVFPTGPAEPVLYHSVPEVQGHQQRPKSNLDLLSLFDQKAPQAAAPAMGMGGMMVSKTDVISALGGGGGYNSSSSSYLSHQSQQQQMGGGSGAIGMMGNNGGGGGMGWNNAPATYCNNNGSGYNPQQQQYQAQPQQQYQPAQQQYQQQTQQYGQTQYQQPQVFRGMTPNPANAPRGPVDAFDFSGQSFMASMQTKH